MIEWAMDRLTAGSDCESTILLAGADHEPDDEVLRLSRKAAHEEGIMLPGAGSELPWLERWICGEIVAGRLEPQAGLTRLCQLWGDSQFDSRFARWLYLSESVVLLEDGYGGIEPFHEMKLEELDSTIVREAKSLIEYQSEHASASSED
jgi:hypothetical protein